MRAAKDIRMSNPPKITGSFEIRATAPSIRAPSDGESFVLTARQMLAGAKVLADSKAPVTLPFALVAAQALEGALKALLWTTGKTVEELRTKQYGHDLVRLWEATASSHFLLSTSPPEWCVCLNTLHAFPFRGRYPSGLNGFVTPNAEQTVLEIDQIFSLAERAVKHAPWREPKT